MEFGSENHEEKFLSYIEKYNKSYQKGSDVYEKRLAIFKVRIGSMPISGLGLKKQQTLPIQKLAYMIQSRLYNQ